MDKNNARLRRAKKTRIKIKQLQMPRLTVHRTPRHMYAQLIMPDGKVIAAISTLNKEIAQECKYCGNIAAAKIVGKAIALKAKKAGFTNVAFDRSGFRYHGRVKAFAEAARENGFEF